MLNIDHLRSSSDYPHTEDTSPFSRERIDKDFGDVPEDESRRMVRAKVAAVYRLH
jgi:hypothetical protein